MRERRYCSLSVKIALSSFIVVAIIAIASMQLKYNELKASYNDLAAKIDTYNNSIDELQTLIDMPFNDEYVEMIAREKLGLCKPEEIIINSDLSE